MATGDYGPRRDLAERGLPFCQGWSVLVRGQAHRVAHPAGLEHMRRDAAIWPWPGDDRDVYVRIIADTISGRGSRAADPVHTSRSAGQQV